MTPQTLAPLAAVAMLLVPASALAGSIAIFDYDVVAAHIEPEPAPPNQFEGPEGDALRAEIKGLYEGFDELSEDDKLAREAQIKVLRRKLIALKPDLPPAGVRQRKIIVEVVKEYADKNGYEIVYDESLITSAHGSIILAGTPPDVTEEVIDLLEKKGLGSREYASKYDDKVDDKRAKWNQKAKMKGPAKLKFRLP